ncbi:ribonuclease P protein component [Mycoplasmopsis cynos]|uniref:ribonuclease P protein component n=1 Tax=Mycoplasmopsis cynos TaxID=171284 RepID=UPI0024CCDC34|nr:ribonuclease P protein component [Mycoplasmopsis cynos]WAM07118.1 ribonuclease P protein component [Mycoplasmopsis cynos]
MQKQFRLKKNWDFQKVIDNKKYVANKYLIIYFLESNEFKIGITIPKKFENSVGRNYNKQQIKAILNQMDILGYKYHFVFIARKEFCRISFKEKEEAVAQLFEKFRIYAKKRII